MNLWHVWQTGTQFAGGVRRGWVMLGKSMYSALPDVYGHIHLVPNTQNIRLKS